MRRKRGVQIVHNPAPNLVYQMQADATLTQLTAASGTLYEVLATTKNVRIISIVALDDWSVDTTTLEVHVTIDGQTITYTVDPNDNTFYFAEPAAELVAASQVLSVNDGSTTRAFLLEGRSVRVQVESTGGTSDSLQCRVKYAIIP